MKLKQLIKNLDINASEGNLDVEITGIAYDSREVKPGNVFIAIPGFKQDGTKFIPEAVKSGAVAVISESAAGEANVARIIVPSSRQALAKVSNVFYDFPSRKVKLIGITGTNGKTSICYLLEHILRLSGFKVGLISTVEIKIDGHGIESKLTTPESHDLQQILDQMARQGVTHVVMEVSSHSLALDRVLETEFDIAVFTNLTHDHLDFHKTMEEYLNAKLKLFSSLGSGQKKYSVAIVNKDDKYAEKIINLLNGKALTYSIESKAELTANNISFDINGSDFNLVSDRDSFPVKTSLIGKSNIYNILASILCSIALGQGMSRVIKSIKSFKGVPGRFEKVDVGQKFPVIVDFAHSPDSLKKLLETYRVLVTGKIILVFGCPGDRDRDKRPVMGEIAAKLADYSIITTDDPHTEEPDMIIEEIESGVRSEVRGERCESIIDRKKAIEKALSMAKKDDIVLIAGRGHEKYQDFSGKKIPIDDREVVKGFLVKLR